MPIVFAGELPGLADRHKGQYRARGHRGSENKAARLHARDRLAAFDLARPFGHWPRNRHARGWPISVVMSRNWIPGLGKSGNGAHQRLQARHSFGCSCIVLPAFDDAAKSNPAPRIRQDARGAKIRYCEIRDDQSGLLAFSVAQICFVRTDRRAPLRRAGRSAPASRSACAAPARFGRPGKEGCNIFRHLLDRRFGPIA